MEVLAGGVIVKNGTCVYCGEDIDIVSKEHIIQNALGGLYESENICCDECNKIIGKYIDVPFTKIFNPIISKIQNFAKTNNSKSHPTCTGKALYNDDIYDVYIKKGKVVSCPELSKKKKCDISKEKFQIISYNFLIDNTSYKNGIAKIAFNFALEKGVELHTIEKGLNIEKSDNGSQIKNISFNYPIIPFVALNPMDQYLELRTNIELYHNLILFNQENKLWCYVDLFNTFQCYVLLSEEWNEEKPILETYLQLLQKPDRSIPDLDIRRSKQILTYAMYYNVEPCSNLVVFKKRVEDAIKKESLKKDMGDVVSAKLDSDYYDANKLKDMNTEDTRSYVLKEMPEYVQSLLLYFDDNDHLKENTFRQVTLLNDGKVVSYPLLILDLLNKKEFDVKSYTYKKIYRLNEFLLCVDSAANEETRL